MADSPLSGAEGDVRVTVLSKGAALPDTVQLISVTVTRAINRVPTARLVFIDGDIAESTFPLSDSDDFRPGVAIRITAGYGDHEEAIFEGIVIKHAIQITGEMDARLVVECHDTAARMTVGRKNASYVDKTDGDIIGALIRAYPLEADVEATVVAHEQLVQYSCSDWDFMLSRAQANGLLVIATDGKVAVKAPDTGSNPTLKVTYGMDLMEFAAETEPGLASSRGRIRFQGSAKAVVGGQIELAGVGKHFSGNVFVSALTHQIGDGIWTTEAEFGLEAPGAAGRLPALEGLQIGVVMKVDGDPDHEHRVQVSVPAFQAETEGVWARLLQFHGSSRFGAFFVPEVGDEVVLGYFNHDLSDAVILGSLYSSRHVTRRRSKIEFDEEDKSITVTTPGNNTIVLDDTGKSVVLHDQNDNRVELDTRGITLSSPTDINLLAKGKITLDAVGAIGIASKGDVKTVGLNISSEAQVVLSAKGTASAELSAAGQTVVKGALVLIN